MNLLVREGDLESPSKGTCIYCHSTVLDREAYSTKEVWGTALVWHYKCFIHSGYEMVPLSEKEQRYIVNLIKLHASDDEIAVHILKDLL